MFLTANGSDEVLDILFKTFIDPGDLVIYFKPSYGMYSTLADSDDATSIELNLTENFELPEEAFHVAGKLMIICSPNNPDGNSVSNEIVKKLCQKFLGIVYVDEAYSDFAEQSALNLLLECPNLIVGRTFSKSFSLASARLGFAVADRQIIQLFDTIRLPYNVTYLSQVAGVAATENWNIISEKINELKEERNRIIQKLKDTGFNILPTQSNFYLMKFDSAEEAARIFQGLKDQKVLTRYWSKPDLARYIRVHCRDF